MHNKKLYGFCSGLKRQPEKARGYASSESSGAVSNEQERERGGFNNPGTSRYEQEIMNKQQRFPGGSNTFSSFPARNAVATTTTTTTTSSDHHLKNSYGAVIISDADDVELHEVQDTNPPPAALHTMIQLLSMFNFMKVELGDRMTLRSKEEWRAAGAEFIGTLLFVYLGCGSVVATGMLSIEMTSARLIAIAMAHGLAISFLTGATGAISGGHLNPAVTLAFVVAGKETLMRAGLYVAAQLLGGTFGALLLKWSTPGTMVGSLGAHDLANGIYGAQGLLLEMVLTFVLVFVIFGVAVDRRGPGVIAPIPIGFAVLVDHLVGVPYTGASMNPARTFGPALVSGNWGRAPLVYWIGPCLGAVLASGVYR
ncbi:unnamed protein product [Sphagnum jensenii]|uniref:Aquaporin n=1 Tax=Sphagnum jensenii TaxID=128206 RepID=A0ABP0X1J1_9BRYO